MIKCVEMGFWGNLVIRGGGGGGGEVEGVSGVNYGGWWG